MQLMTGVRKTNLNAEKYSKVVRSHIPGFHYMFKISIDSSSNPSMESSCNILYHSHHSHTSCQRDYRPKSYRKWCWREAKLNHSKHVHLHSKQLDYGRDLEQFEAVRSYD